MQKICFSGNSELITRSDAINQFKSKGYEVRHSVSKNVDILVTKQNNTSKCKDAIKLGIKIISYEDAMELLK